MFTTLTTKNTSQVNRPFARLRVLLLTPEFISFFFSEFKFSNPSEI